MYHLGLAAQQARTEFFELHRRDRCGKIAFLLRSSNIQRGERTRCRAVVLTEAASLFAMH